jgi:hypothetical protein
MSNRIDIDGIPDVSIIPRPFLNASEGASQGGCLARPASRHLSKAATKACSFTLARDDLHLFTKNAAVPHLVVASAGEKALNENMFTSKIIPSRSILTLLAVAVLPLQAARADISGAIESVNVVQGTDRDSLLVPGGFAENAKAFTDRTTLYIQTNNAPFLIGADYVQLQNAARDDNPFEVQVTLDTAFPAVEMYLLIDRRVDTATKMTWLSTQGWVNQTAGLLDSKVIAINESARKFNNIWFRQVEAPETGRSAAALRDVCG